MSELILGRWPKREPISWKAWCAYVAERLEAVGEIVIPSNAGNRRTDSKKALLKAIGDAGGKR